MTKISIIMGAYNCEKTIDESIQSILNQTCQEWELIVCDDCSGDNTYNILKKYEKQYDNIIVLKNHVNLGLNETLNKCLDKAKGEYIARMDADDISLPERLEREAEFLDKNREIDIVSSPMIYFDNKGDWGQGKQKEYPEKKDFIYGTPFCHAPCMVRREAYKKVNGYSVNKHLLRVEDYHLWIKMYREGFKGYNFQEPLYKMRDDRNAYSRRKYKYRINEAYVRFLAFYEFKLPIYTVMYILRPLIVGLLPEKIYSILHKRARNK